MPIGGSVWDNAKGGFQTEQEIAAKTLFPAKDRFQMLQMITETAPRAEMPWSVLGIFRRRFKSEVLSIFQEENNVNQIAKERKGRLELETIFSRPRLKSEDDEEKT